MTWAFIAKTFAGSTSGNGVTTSDIDTTGATYGFVSVNTIAAGPAPTLTDSKGNTYSLIGSHLVNAQVRLSAYECINPIVGTGHNLTIAAINNSASIFAAFFSGVRLAGPDDQTATLTSGDEQTFQVGGITPSDDACLVIAAASIIEYNGSGPTLDSGFTYDSIVSNSDGGNHVGGILGYKIQTTAAAVDPTFDSGFADTADHAALLYSFLPQLAGPVITTDNFANGRIFQRAAGTEAKTLTFSGMYDTDGGDEPDSIEVIVYEHGTSTVVQTWTAIGSPDIADGAWSGTLSVPQGGWYSFKSRYKDDADAVIATSIATTSKVGVGILVATLGQSNMEHMYQPFTTPTPNSLTRMFGGNWEDVEGNGAILLADKLQVATGLPIGLLAYAIGGTGLVEDVGNGAWSSLAPGDPYPLFADGLTAAGGDCEFVLWHQGEADAEVSVTKANYKDALDTLYGRIRAATARTKNHLKFGCAVLGPLDDGTDQSVSDIRQAHIEWSRGTAGAFLAGSSIDMVLLDFAHWDGAPYYERMARRYANAVLNQLDIESNGSIGPSITGVEWRGRNVIVSLAQNSGGTELRDAGGNTDGADITGFEVSTDDFATTLPIESTEFDGAFQINIILASSVSASSELKLRYLWGNVPDTSNAVFDDADPQGDSVGFPLLPAVELTAVNSLSAGEDDLDAELVPTSRTSVLVPTSTGLRSEHTKVLIVGSPANTYAIDFREDAACGQRIAQIISVTIQTGSEDGLVISDDTQWGREGTKAKVRIAGITAGDYVVRVAVKYTTGSVSRGDVLYKVVN